MERKTLIIIISSVLAITFLTVFLVFFGLKPKQSTKYEVDLEIWGLFDDSDVFREIFENFKKIDPDIRSINYKKFTVENYESDLLEAMASGQGPDIFIIHNTWLPSFQDKMTPAYSTIISEQKFKKDFMDVAAEDFISEGEIYAVPLTIDSLALFYNKDLFNSAGIPLPPSNWEDFLKDVKIITKLDEFGSISRSGAAMGTSNNINRSTDILSLLIMQQGGEMNYGNQVAFDNQAGEKALAFYTDFSKKSSSYYSWNPQMHNSLDAFSEGNLAMMFNYSWQIEAIKRKNPKLNFSVAPFPQITDQNRISYANYWGYGVSKNKNIKTEKVTSNNKSGISPLTNEVRIFKAWKLLKFMASKADSADYFYNEELKLDPKFDAAALYAEKTKKPVARRDLVEMQKTDPTLGVFAEQNVFAKSWKQIDPRLVEGSMSEMITDVNFGRKTLKEALRNTVAKINQSLK
jgi:multiple sugar transport system substrate-binding protein